VHVLEKWKDPEVRMLLLLSVSTGILSSVALSAAYRKIAGREDVFKHPYLTGTVASLLTIAWAEYVLARSE